LRHEASSKDKVELREQLPFLSERNSPRDEKSFAALAVFCFPQAWQTQRSQRYLDGRTQQFKIGSDTREHAHA
jgi:hypothetical protein